MRPLATAAACCVALALAAAQPQSPLVRNVTKACQNQRRRTLADITGDVDALLGRTDSKQDGDGGLERLEGVAAHVFARQPLANAAEECSLYGICKQLPTYKPSAPCLKAMNRIVDLAKKGDQTPIKQLACSLGLRPDDTGDFYTCDQMTYPGEDGKDAGLSYWTMALGHHDTGNRRMLQRTLEGSLVPDNSLAANVAGRLKRRLQHGGWHPKIGLCFPSECSHEDLWQAGPHYLQSLRVNATVCNQDKDDCPGEAHASSESNATQFWIESIEQTGGHTEFGMLDFGAGFWIVVSGILITLTACATTPQPWGIKDSGVASAGKGSMSAATGMNDRSTTDPIMDTSSVTTKLRVGATSGLIQSGGEVVGNMPPATPSFCVRLVRNWDMTRNYTSLHKPDPGHVGLKMLNGVRVIAIFLVVLGHTYAFMHVDNDPYARNIVEKRFMTRWLIGNPGDSTGGAFVSVDTFFFLSGFLAMLSQLEKYSLSSGPDVPLCRFWGKAVLFRFLRLTPMYLFVLMIYIYVFPLVGNGPEWHPGMEDLYQPKMKEFCREMWWTNILYISNLFPGQLGARNPDPGWLGHLNGPKQFAVDGRMPNGEGELGCYIQTWYLSNDMQLFLLTPVVAVLFKRNRQHAYALLVTVLVLMHAYIIYLTTSYKLSTCDQLTDNPPYGGGDDSPPHTGDFQVMLYDKPWYRPGYYVGVLLACVYVDQRDPESKAVPKLTTCVQRAIYWAVLIVLFVYSSVGSYSNTYEKLGPKTFCPKDHGGSGPCHHYMGSTTTCAWSRPWDVLYSSFFRTTWCISLGMILWAALASQGGPVVAVLSVNFWTPIARLTFGVYLTHIMVIRLLYNSTERQFNYNDYFGATVTTSNYTLSLLCSFAVYVLVEKPFANLTMMLLAPPRRARPSVSAADQ